MRRWLFPMTLVGALLALAACAAKEEAKPPPAAPAAPAPAPGAKAAWEEVWDRVLAAAKREGKVTVTIPPGPGARKALTELFEKRYGISVETVAAAGPELVAKVKAEREGGQYLWDIYVSGTTSGLALRDLRALDPLEPALILPEVKEPKGWRGGALEFADRDRQILVMTPFQRGTLFINTNLVRPGEIRSYKDLLDPKWKGKIVSNDPRVGGPGQATYAFFFRHPDLGPDFIRALARQEPTLLRDFRQEMEFLAQGRVPVVVGSADHIAEPMIKQGLPILIVDPGQIREGSDVSPAAGALAIFNRPPHPNAARVYANWLLTKEAQTEFARAMGYVSSRLDVSTDHVPAWRVPKAGAIKTYDEEALGDVRRRMLVLLREVFGE